VSYDGTLLLEEFGCNYYKYKEGYQNLVTNTLSRVLTSRLVREKTAGPGEKNLISQPNQPQEPYKDNQACITEENSLLAECLLVYPVFDKCDVTHHPFHFTTMRHYQQRSNATKQLLIDQPKQYTLVTVGETNLICYIANPQQPKIVLTDNMLLPRIVRYYRLTAQHAEGMDRLEWSLKQHFYHLRLRDEVHLQVSRCKICQNMKRYSTNSAQVPAREATSVPWEQVHRDLIGPWNIKVKGHKKPVQFIALTRINPVLNLLEVGTVKDKTSKQVTKTFERLV
jgi:hypothetical protein